MQTILNLLRQFHSDTNSMLNSQFSLKREAFYLSYQFKRNCSHFQERCMRKNKVHNKQDYNKEC
jgi:predicted GNAT family N-acyltransferase